jgi:hypothetical protein
LNLLLDKEHWARSHPCSPTANTSFKKKKKKRQPTQATKLASIGATDRPEPHCKDQKSREKANEKEKKIEYL